MMDNYTTILNEGSFEYEDRKSVFYGFAAPVKSEEDALAFISKIKKTYPDARHHVYAYVLRENSIMRFSDDREPQGTAGMPVLDAIRKNGCTDCAIVVIRYFGGVLLGTGGLVRAYSSSANGALKAGQIATYTQYCYYKITVNYSDYQRVLPLCEESLFKCNDTKFYDNVIVFGKIEKARADDFLRKLGEITSARANAEFLEEKLDY